MFVLHGRVGLMMRMAVALAWKDSGRRLEVGEERMMALELVWQGVEMVIGSVYIPTVAQEKDEIFEELESIRGKWRGKEEIWAGDWNANFREGDPEEGAGIGPTEQQATPHTEGNI